MLAILRPDSWNWLLTFHLLAAAVLVTASMIVTLASLLAMRSAEAGRVTVLRGLAFRTNLIGVLPGYIATIVLGHALAEKEYGEGEEPDWLGPSIGITELGGVLGGIVLSVLLWFVVRKARKGELRGALAAITSYIAPLILVSLLVVLFLMTAKPE
ncbi:MAG: hypothetical protein ABR521_14030 [Gaiellaceae bacterium]